MRSPPQITAAIPLMLKCRSVPGPLISTRSESCCIRVLSAFIPGLQPAIIEACADFEIEIFECFGAHARQLRHCGSKASATQPILVFSPTVILNWSAFS